MNRILLALAFSTALAAQSKVGVLHVQGQVYLIYGAGSNITMQAGDQAVVLVDSGPASMSAEVMKAIRTVSPKPIAYIISTSYDRDHTGGNGNRARGRCIKRRWDPRNDFARAKRASRAKRKRGRHSRRVNNAYT